MRIVLRLIVCAVLGLTSCKCSDEAQRREPTALSADTTIVNASRTDQAGQPDLRLRMKFGRLLRRWDRHCANVMYSSRHQDYLNCQAYRDIVGLGKPALPLIVDAMKHGGNIWLFLAIRDITGVTPAALGGVTADGGWNLGHVRDLYIQWWDAQGIHEFTP